MNTYYGFDASQYNGAFTVGELNSSGKSFWYFKGGGGDGSSGCYEDLDFTANMIAAQASTLKYGVYWFAGNTVSTVEADWAYNNLWSGLTVGAVPILDLERGSNGLPSVQWAVDFLNQSKNHLGFYPMIYMNQNTENSYDWSPVVAMGVGLIIADYAVSPEGNVKLAHWPFYFGQQYSSSGNVSGHTPLDLDAIFCNDINDWNKYGKQAITAVATPPSVPSTPTPVTPPVEKPLPQLDNNVPKPVTPPQTVTPPTPIVVVTPSQSTFEKFWKWLINFLKKANKL